MSNRVYIGIDNGVSGTIGIITPECSYFYETPVYRDLDFHKTRPKYLNRLDFDKFKGLLTDVYLDPFVTIALLERPYSNATRYTASTNALRCWEATLIALKQLGFKRDYADSKGWQGMLLPKGIKGSDAQKEASRQVGLRLFPEHAKMINKHKDADGLLIAEWAKRSNL